MNCIIFSDSIPSLTISDPSMEDSPMPKIEDLNKPPPLPDTTNVQKIVIDVKARADENLTIRFQSFTCLIFAKT